MSFARTLLITLEFTPFKGGVARYYEHFAHTWGEGMTVYTATQAISSSSRAAVSFGERTASGVERSQNLTYNEIPRQARDDREDVCQVIRKAFYWKWVWPHWLKLFFDLFFYLKKNPVSVVFVGNVLPVGVVVWFLQYVFHYDVVTFAHGLDIRERALPNRWKVWLAKQIFFHSVQTITNSAYTAQVVQGKFGVAEDRIQIIFPQTTDVSHRIQNSENRSDRNSFPSMVRMGIRQTLNEQYHLSLNPEDVVILSVGRLVQRKGWDKIVSTAKQVTDPRVKFIFIGDGPERTYLAKKISASKMDGRLFLMPPGVSDAEKDLFFEACDIFLLLPKDLGGDVEGFGIVFLEAGAHALPVIGRDSGGVRDAIRHEETGFLWDGNEEKELLRYLNILINDPQKRQMMGEAGRLFAQRLGQESHAQIQYLKDALTSQSAKVSIVIPVGYEVDRIRATLRSLEKQTYKNFEVIVVLDGITPPTPPLTLRGGEGGVTFPLRNISIPKGGAAAARNAGAEQSTGKYLLFVDDDTRLREDCIEKMIRRLQMTNDKLQISSKFKNLNNQEKNEQSAEWERIDFVYSGFRFGWKTMPAVPFDRNIAYHYPYFDTTSMLRRDRFPGFDESLKRLQDWDLFLTVLDHGGRGEAIHEILYFKDARLFKNLFKWKGISFWFPKFVWKVPGLKRLYNRLSPVKAYVAAQEEVLKKHGLMV